MFKMVKTEEYKERGRQSSRWERENEYKQRGRQSTRKEREK